MLRLFTTTAILTTAFAATTFADETITVPTFERHVRPILKTHCFQCHGEEEELQGGLDLRLARFAKTGGDSGPAVVPGNHAESLLYHRIAQGEMPPDDGKRLSSEEVKTILDWINSGAQTVREEPESLDGVFLITEEERAHWSFQPIRRPAVPLVNHTADVANPIDAFLLAKLEAHGFAFSAAAQNHTLIRRLYLDLHGVPPTPAQVEQFVNNPGPTAWRDLVDQLLSSSRYGERWARHWLDVAGYADSEGYSDVDAERNYAWRYRDYVIRAMNTDKPFDNFIREQLAGDELVTSPLDNLSDHDAELLSATGFLRMAPDGTAGSVADINQARNDTIADTIQIVSTSLLGLTVGCAQCHDHRYDPISQEDYYRFRAVFEPAFDWKKWRTPAQRRVSLYTDQDRARAAEVEAEARKIDEERSAKQAEYISATFEKQLASLPAELHQAARAAHATAESKRTDAQKALFRKHPSLNVTSGSLYLYDRKASDHLKEMADAAAKVRATKPAEEFVRALTESGGTIPTTFVFHRGDHEQPKQEVSAAGLTVVSLNAELPEIPPAAAEIVSSGRRLALANRLTHPDHPLTARVIVNRIWMHHFGRGLVRTAGDFGVLGEAPTHPELLDWLAREFIDSGWSLKHLHRLMLNSNAWRQQLRTDDNQEQADPDNRLYGGSLLRRLDAEVVRDCMLSVTDQLVPRPFGPAVPVMADRVGRFVIGRENLNAGRPGAVVDMKGEQFRRSIYIQVRRSRPLSILHAFDRPEMTPNCDFRRPSTSSTQSLLLMNSDELLQYSRSFADRLMAARPSTEEQIRLAWNLAYARSPEHSELDAAVQFLRDETQVFASQSAYAESESKKPARTAAQDALAVLCQVLLSSNEFLYID